MEIKVQIEKGNKSPNRKVRKEREIKVRREKGNKSPKRKGK